MNLLNLCTLVLKATGGLFEGGPVGFVEDGQFLEGINLNCAAPQGALNTDSLFSFGLMETLPEVSGF